MASNTLKARLSVCVKTASDWASNTTVLLKGELGIESDTLKAKVGDGQNVFKDLAYLNVTPTNLTTILADYAKINNPAFTGTPTAPTAAAGTNTTQIATTAFVTSAVSTAISGVTQFDYEVVTKLPNKGTKGVIYLVADTHDPATSDSYDEYIWIGGDSGSFEKLGNTDINLSGYYTKSEVDTELSKKSDTGHTHDDRYYTESEMDTKLSGKSDTGHTHDDRYYTESEMDTKLGGKQATITGAATTITSSDLTASRALISNASGKVAVSDVTSTELGYLDGVTSNIQTQIDSKSATGHTHTLSNITDFPTSVSATELGYLDGVTSAIQTQIDSKQATITGAATTITGSNLTASRALISNASGKVAVSDVTSTELGYLDGVTSNVQTQIDAKQAAITGAATTITDSNLTASRALVSNSSGKVGVSSVTSTELGYVSGVTSAIQTQIDGKLPNTTKYAASASVGGDASKAVQLSNSRNFSIAGGATAAAVSFNGTQNVELNVTNVSTSVLYVPNGDTLILDGSF